MKKLIFLFILLLIFWKMDIIGTALVYYKYSQDPSDTLYFPEKEDNKDNHSEINDSVNSLLEPEIKVKKQYMPDQESLDRIAFPKEKSVYKKRSTVQKYRCDGRVWCSQMHSCEEAIFFINHCPGTKMDGDHDGRPCEKQWCRHK